MIPKGQIRTWIDGYLNRQADLVANLPGEEIASLVELVRETYESGNRIFAVGNGGNACNASHFATDLGKGSSDAMETRFKVISLNDNSGWMTAIGNDYSYDDVFRRQLENYGEPGDLLITSSVSGSSPNLLEAVKWASGNGLRTVAVVGANRGNLADEVDLAVVIPDGHYGRVEDAQMTIYHLLCYAFMESAPENG